MPRPLLIVGTLLIVAGLIVTWVTAYNPILGHRELNWIVIGVGAWCCNRAGVRY